MAAHSRWWAILRQRCPQCREGRIFRGHFAMHERCPVCSLKFEREQGYFLGAMYISYPLSIPILGLGVLIGYLLFPSWRIEFVVLLSAAWFVPFSPAVFRYSRVIWIHFDRWASPGKD